MIVAKEEELINEGNNLIKEMPLNKEMSLNKEMYLNKEMEKMFQSTYTATVKSQKILGA